MMFIVCKAVKNSLCKIEGFWKCLTETLWKQDWLSVQRFKTMQYCNYSWRTARYCILRFFALSFQSWPRHFYLFVVQSERQLQCSLPSRNSTMQCFKLQCRGNFSTGFVFPLKSKEVFYCDWTEDACSGCKGKLWFTAPCFCCSNSLTELVVIRSMIFQIKTFIPFRNIKKIDFI